jgi:hypothetical protein
MVNTITLENKGSSSVAYRMAASQKNEEKICEQWNYWRVQMPTLRLGARCTNERARPGHLRQLDDIAMLLQLQAAGGGVLAFWA